MFSVLITEKGGSQQRLEFEKAEITLGRARGNDIILPKGNVSKRHSRIVFKEGRYIVVDLKSTNGTYVNGRKIASPLVIKPGDKIYIGDFMITLEDVTALGATGDRRPGTPPPLASREAPAPLLEPTSAPREGFDDSEPPSEPPSAPPPPLPGPTMSDDFTGVDARIARDSFPKDSPLPAAPVPAGPSPEFPRPSNLAAGFRKDEPSQRMATGGAPRPISPTSADTGAMEVVRRRETDTPGGAPHAPARAPQPSMPRPPAREPSREPGPMPREAPSMRRQDDLAGFDQIMARVANHFDTRNTDAAATRDERRWQQAQQAVASAIAQAKADGALDSHARIEILTTAAVHEAVGLGPLDALLSTDQLREIVVESYDRIAADLGRGLEPAPGRFSSMEALATVASRLAHAAGIAHPGAQSVQEGRLPDGAHIVMVHPPVAVTGPIIAIRKPLKQSHSLRKLLDGGVLSREMADLLTTAVAARRNILVTGTVGAGVSTMLGALAGVTDVSERLVTIEKVPDLSTGHERVIPLALGGADTSLRDLLQQAGSFRPDRLILDDVIGLDAYAILVTMATRRDGNMLGMHATSPRDALRHLQVLAQLGSGSVANALGALVADAVHLAVHVAKLPDGSRRVVNVCEIGLGKNDQPELHDLYTFRGDFVATGHQARFLSDTSHLR